MAAAGPIDQFASPYIGMGCDPVNNVDKDGGWIDGVVLGASGGVVVTGIKKAASSFWSIGNLLKTAASFVPVVGAVMDIAEGFANGDGLQVAIGAVSLVVDLATFGSGSIAKGAAITIAKETAEQTTKAIVKETAEQIVDAGTKKLAREVAEKTTKEVAEKAGKETGQAAQKLKKFKTPCGCFVAGTKILTENGYENIEAIKVGSLVVAFNDTTGQFGLKRVTTLYRYERDSVYEIIVSNTKINATADHPFYIAGHWLKVVDLRIGDSVKLFDGSKLVIEQITVVPGRTIVYNFEVEDYHTYYVSDLRVLVHNNGGVPCPTGLDQFPKLPKGKGSVPPKLRDPKRSLTKQEKKEMLDDLGGKCEGCDTEITINEARAHHKNKRWADGAKTTKEENAILCSGCHIKIHQ